MTDDEYVELLAKFKAGTVKVLYADREVTVYFHISSKGRAYVFSDMLDIPDRLIRMRP